MLGGASFGHLTCLSASLLLLDYVAGLSHCLHLGVGDVSGLAHGLLGGAVVGTLERAS